MAATEGIHLQGLAKEELTAAAAILRVPYAAAAFLDAVFIATALVMSIHLLATQRHEAVIWLLNLPTV